ncbi:unnamed protein product [Prorocentrum cordatum]|uniref:Uncharacterized protein n=1 Tax=Prorocentrum cordatum TaxID=2364126 RepID=A0ABN9WNR3_9DINO|nr:unnamed protein product [Polarella glacialis]
MLCGAGAWRSLRGWLGLGAQSGAFPSPTLAREIIDGTLNLSTLPRPMLLSGACDGADSLFGRHAIAADHDAVHLLGPGDREWASEAAKSGEVGKMLDVEADLLDDPAVSRAFRVAGERRVLGSQRADGWEAKAAAMSARRNFLQVRRAGAVYAVGWRLAKGADQFTGREAVAPGDGPFCFAGGRPGGHPHAEASAQGQRSPLAQGSSATGGSARGAPPLAPCPCTSFRAGGCGAGSGRSVRRWLLRSPRLAASALPRRDTSAGCRRRHWLGLPVVRRPLRRRR